MRRAVILDTEPLVAPVDGRDQDHGWAVDQWSQIVPPLITCESVISEACFLLAQTRTGGAPVLEMLAPHVLSLPFRLGDDCRTVRALMRKYADVPMSLADACLVRLAEVTIHSTVLTLDRDFQGAPEARAAGDSDRHSSLSRASHPRLATEKAGRR